MKPREFLASIRGNARESAVEEQAAVKRPRKSLTCGELDDAIFAVCNEMGPCTARETMEALHALTGYGRTDRADDIVSLDGTVPISCAQLDESLAEAEKYDLPASTLGPLRRFRELLEQAEARKAKELARYVTAGELAELKAQLADQVDAFGWAVGAMATEFNRGQPSQSHVLDLLGRSANTEMRRTLLARICEFKEEQVPQRTQQEFLRYQSRGHW